jgi:hypothetical protein
MTTVVVLLLFCHSIFTLYLFSDLILCSLSHLDFFIFVLDYIAIKYLLSSIYSVVSAGNGKVDSYSLAL